MTQPGAQWQESSTAEATAGLRARRMPAWGQPVANRSQALGLTLAVLLLIATVGVWTFNLRVQAEHTLVNLLGNLVFLGVSSVLIAYVGIRGFLRSGAWPVLWLAAGSLVFGFAVTLSGPLLAWVSADAATTTQDLGALFAGLLHTIGAFFTANGVAPLESLDRRRSVLRQVFGVSLLAVVLVAATSQLLPPFFVQGVGGTPVRQMIIAAAILLYTTAGLIFLRYYSRTRAAMVYWYALGLLLRSVGMAALLTIVTTGTPLNWIGRICQWTGGLYLLVAALTTVGEARSRRMAADEVLASYFQQRGANLRQLFSSIQDAIIVTDQNFVVTGWNRGAEAIYGWGVDEVLGRPLAEIVQTEYAEGARSAAIADLFAAGTSQSEVIQHHRSGREVVVLASVSAVKDEAGRAIGAVAVNRDITERRRADEEIKRLNADLARRAVDLEASNNELEAFAYSVSHDLRAPLRGVDGFSLALLEDYTDRLDEEGREYLRMLRQNAQRMGELIDDLLSLSRVGRAQLQPQTVRVGELVRRVWNDLRPEWEGRSVEFKLGPLPDAEADATLLKQVWANLLSNALKFSRGRTPAVIEVGARETDGATAFYVKDNGAGFDMQYAGKLFGVFQRLHRAEDYEGTGVGLAIVLRIVQRHGGRAWAEGRVGEGATFYFTLGGGAGERTD